jgi:hypothetical protein
LVTTVVANFGPGTVMTVSEVYCGDRGAPAWAPQSLTEIVRADEDKVMVIKALPAKDDVPKVVVAKQ